MPKLLYNIETLVEDGGSKEIISTSPFPFRLASVSFTLDGASTVDFSLSVHKAIKVHDYDEAGNGLTTVTNEFGYSEDIYRYSDRLVGIYDDPMEIQYVSADQTVDKTSVVYEMELDFPKWVYIEEGDVIELDFGAYAVDVPVVIQGVD